MDNVETFHNKTLLSQKKWVSYSKQTCLYQYRSSKAMVVMDNVETVHHTKIVVVEIFGFRFEADFFK